MKMAKCVINTVKEAKAEDSIDYNAGRLVGMCEAVLAAVAGVIIGGVVRIILK